MKKLTHTTTIFLLFFHLGFSQEYSHADFELFKEDFEIFEKRVNEISDSSQTKAKDFINFYLQLAEEKQDSFSIFSIRRILGENQKRFGEYDEALENYSYSLSSPYFESLQTDEKKWLKIGLLLAQSSLLRLGKKTKVALEKAIEAEGILKRYKGDDLGQISVVLFNTLGAIYSSENDYTNSILYRKKALTHAERLNHKCALLNNIGSSFSKLENYDSAFYYFNRSLILNPPPNEKFYSIQGIAATHSKMESFYEAIKYLKKALIVAQKNNFKKNEISAKRFIGQLQYLTGEYTDAIKNLNDINEVYKKAGNLAALKKNDKYIIGSKIALSSGEKLKEEFEAIIDYRDSLNNVAQKKEFEKLKVSYETEKKEVENKLQAITIQKQRISLLGAIGGIGFLGLASFLFYNQSLERKKKNKLLLEKNQKIESLHNELSHRVKNNLAFVSSLLKMQGRRLENKEAKAAVQEGENRIQAMSLLNRKLYLQDNSKVLIGNYLEEICAHLKGTYSGFGTSPKINLEVENLYLEAENAVRLGLIINELITNSFKYAFPNNSNPEINLHLKREEENIHLSYRDNGIGIPLEKDVSKTKSLGLKLIHTLTRQLDGTLQKSNDSGAVFDFQFKQQKLTL